MLSLLSLLGRCQRILNSVSSTSLTSIETTAKISRFNNSILSSKNVLPNPSLLLSMIKHIIPPLSYDFHKGQAGRIVVIGGSEVYTGAPAYAALSALRTGADLARIFCAKLAALPIKSYSPELMVLAALDKNTFDESSIEKILASTHCVVVGPGLATDSQTFEIIEQILQIVQQLKIPLIIDASAINFVISKPNLFSGYKQTIITPNKAEFWRMYEKLIEKNSESNCSQTSPIKDRIGTVDDVMQLSRALGGVTIVMKGAVDIISNGENALICSVEGSPRRCGGQGDILAGSMATFLSWSIRQNQLKTNSEINFDGKNCAETYGPTIVSSYAACHLIRESSKQAFKKNSRATLTTDILEEIGPTFKNIFVD